MCYYKHQSELERLTIKKGNLLEIRESTIFETNEAINRPRSGSLNNKRIVYTANALREIRLLQHDHRFKILPFGAIDNIRKFKLNNKPIKNNQHDHRFKILLFGAIDNIRKFKLNNKPIKNNKHHQGHHQDRPDHGNLVKINKAGYKLDSRIIFATSNVQSIRLKELQVSQLISDYSLDFLVLTETWLNSNHDLWKDTCTLNRDHLRLHTVDQKEGRGGGLALINRSQYPCRIIHSGSKPSFEFAAWELKVKNAVITIHGIYHPPYSYK